MRTNKRTVWFLTLLSLVAVISIYYIKEKSPMPFDGINIFKDTENSVEIVEKTGDSEKTAPVFAEAYVFEEMRMEVRNVRSKLGEQLMAKMLSSETTAEEKTKVFDEMGQLTKQESAEALMELEIKAMGYPEAFVYNEDGEVKITVLSSEGHSAKMAEEITHYVKTSWKDAKKVTVAFTGDAE
ncbi:SpoIIIAH-like family protein [Sporosarcina sp. ANT_H38]|uniref:SpoIIIAH-like family protein n=1 Tax=Sporosarcina sp. ANT_H38 TaxID=2597358 RepID=UPI0011F2FA67|nr:SpoIIIAH-like family protein [Sporosarcina sp. ANT_H38]KAA0966022.1 SpoIIIAH-like family protein [Sporosarcina sp. ANT_H38]